MRSSQVWMWLNMYKCVCVGVCMCTSAKCSPLSHLVSKLLLLVCYVFFFCIVIIIVSVDFSPKSYSRYRYRVVSLCLVSYQSICFSQSFRCCWWVCVYVYVSLHWTCQPYKSFEKCWCTLCENRIYRMIYRMNNMMRHAMELLFGLHAHIHTRAAYMLQNEHKALMMENMRSREQELGLNHAI